MSKKKTRLVLLCLVILAIIAVALPMTAHAQKAKPNTQKSGAEGNLMLRLTDEQRDKVQAIRMRFEEKMEDVRFELRKQRFELAYLLRQGEEDRNKIDAKIDEILVLEKKRHKMILDEYFEMKKILTPQQNRIFLRHMIRAMMRERK